jgi:hypothetical protein
MTDQRVKHTEFRATKSTDNPIHIIGFLSQWKLYLDQLQTSNLKEGEVFKGRALQEEYFDKVSRGRISLVLAFGLNVVVSSCRMSKLVNCTNSCMPRRIYGRG